MPNKRYPTRIDVDLVIPTIIIGLLAGLIISRWLHRPVSIIWDNGFLYSHWIFVCCRREDFFVSSWNLALMGAKNDDTRVVLFVQNWLRSHGHWVLH
jgi:hypothetical protein